MDIKQQKTFCGEKYFKMTINCTIKHPAVFPKEAKGRIITQTL
jgi:hypothetical protein